MSFNEMSKLVWFQWAIDAVIGNGSFQAQPRLTKLTNIKTSCFGSSGRTEFHGTECHWSPCSHWVDPLIVVHLMEKEINILLNDTWQNVLTYLYYWFSCVYFGNWHSSGSSGIIKQISFDYVNKVISMTNLFTEKSFCGRHPQHFVQVRLPVVILTWF